MSYGHQVILGDSHLLFVLHEVDPQEERGGVRRVLSSRVPYQLGKSNNSQNRGSRMKS